MTGTKENRYFYTGFVKCRNKIYNRGVNYLSTESLFNQIDETLELPEREDSEFEVKVSLIEIYKENLTDLLGMLL